MKHMNKRRRKVGYLFPTLSSKSPVPVIRLSGKWLEEAGFGIGQEFVLTVREGEIRLLKAEAEENPTETAEGGIGAK